MPRHQDHLRKQIADSIAQPASTIEKRIAESLSRTGEFSGSLDADDLALILRKVLFTLVDEQKVAGLDVPITHNVSRMDVSIADCEVSVFAEVHIHEPIVGFITFRYTLENDPRARGQKLRLKDNHVEVSEITKPLDFAAKLALKIMNVRAIALHELHDPNAVIVRTLPEQLLPYGFEGDIETVDLEILRDDTLLVGISVDGQA